MSKYTNRSRRTGFPVALATLALWLLAFAPPALAGPPTHLHKPALDIGGFDHACGAAVDSEGDVYVASAGESKITVFDPAHAPLVSIPNPNEPCGLAVDSKGNLYVSEQATGNVVKYTPNAYPFTGPLSYGAPVAIDSSGDAKGISVDPRDDRLYVAEGSHVAVYEDDGSFAANVGEPELSEATGVAAYTYGSGNPFGMRLYLFVADPHGAAADRVHVFSGTGLGGLKPRRQIDGSQTPDGSFGFGLAGAHLAVDPGNPSADGKKCASIAEQACTAGHFLLYDDAHEVVDEFDATGEFLDRFTNPALADAEPTGLAVDRSGGPSDGTIYVTAGPGPGAQLLAFGPLATPSRPPLPELSRVLKGARSVATDSFGNVYVAAEAKVHVFSPGGEELTGFEPASALKSIAVDGEGNVYTIEGALHDEEITYYTPSAKPPVKGSIFSRHAPPLLHTTASFTDIAVNPANDHLFGLEGLLGGVGPRIVELGSAKAGSPTLDPDWGSGLDIPSFLNGIDIHAASGNVYLSMNTEPNRLFVIDPTGTEILARVSGAGSPEGLFIANPGIAVDQSNGHVVEFERGQAAVREYDASGAPVAQFGAFTPDGKLPEIAIDNACALHNPPLSETTSPTCKQFDPANGNVYLAFDASAPGTFDLSAFGPLSYGEPPIAVSGVADGLGAGNATLHGTVDPRGFDLEACRFEYLTEGHYVSNGETFAGATIVPCAESLAEIGHGSGPVAVHADVGGLDPETSYRYRLFAQSKYGESAGGARLFGPPAATTKGALPILYDEATLRGEVDPSGLATKYHFEYGTTEAYGQSTPVGELAPSDDPVAVQAPLTGLAEGTEYHFRLVAENEAKAEVKGLDLTLVTLERAKAEDCSNTEFRTGLSAKLPDCRAYELITPAEPGSTGFAAVGGGGPGLEFNNWLVAPRGNEAGESLAYFAATMPGFDGSGGIDGYRAQRGAGAHPAAGWTNELFGPTYAQVGIGGSGRQRGVAADQRYWFFGIGGEEPLEETLEGEYLRTPAGFEVLGQGSLGTDMGAGARYVSGGGTHVVFFSKAHLEDEAAPAGTVAIYDRAAGSSSAEVVSVKPDGSPFGAGQDASYVASSEDGAAVVFTVAGALYLHRGGTTTEIAAAPSTFAGISADGERVFYLDTTFFAEPPPAGLFVCEVQAGPCAGPGAQAPTEIASDSILINVSPDGSQVFFSSKDALTGSEESDNHEQAQAGERNLYVWDGASTRFLAVLDPADFLSFGGEDLEDMFRWTKAISAGQDVGRANSPTRATPDGEVFVFQSHAQLTAYDNGGHGAIYRYAPAAEPGARLTCVSCDPSGAAASGDALLQIFGGKAGGVTRESTLIPNVTDDGSAVFFQSPDRLLPEDANGVQDVYEWKAKGAGGCQRLGGCLALISSGQGERSSLLYGMSADGRDLIFATNEKLVGQDVPGSQSLYDARVQGGIPNPPAKAPCEGDACQGAGAIPPALPTPTSAGIRPSEIAVKQGRAPCGKGKRKVRQNGKARCVKKKQHKKRRANNHERRTSR